MYPRRVAYSLLFLLLTGFAYGQEIYFPPDHSSGEWATLSPESLNWHADSIASLYQFLAGEQTDAFIVLKDGKIVLEEYFGNYTQDSIHFWASASKSLSALLYGVAQEQTLLDINDPVVDYLGEGWTSLSQEREDSITLRNQLTMTSGLNELFFSCTLPACLVYRAPVNQRWAYHNSPYSLMKAVLEAASGETMNAFTNSSFENKVGGSNGFWLPYDAYSTTYFSSARLMARFGLLIQNGGNWDGVPVIADTSYFNAMLSSSQSMNPSYGYLWWLNGKDSYIGPDAPVSIAGPISPDAPEDVILAAGARGQFVSISRAEGLVLIRQGDSNDESLAPIHLHNEIWRRLRSAQTISSITENENAANSHTNGANKLPAIKAYPNPARNLIHFESPFEEDFWVSLYDQRGRLLCRAKNARQIARNNLPAGVYRLTINASGNSISEWVVFQ